MAKKRRRKRRKRDKSLIEIRFRNFGEEIEAIAENFGKRMERKGKKWEKKHHDWWFRTFGFIGPIIGSIFGLVFLGFGIWVLNLVNLPLRSSFILVLSNFLFRNLHWFFGAFLFFGYSDYFSKRFSKTYCMVSPIVSSIGIIFVIWISIWILNSINTFAGSSVIASVSNFLYVNLSGIFVVFLVLGYAVTFIKKFIKYSLGG